MSPKDFIYLSARLCGGFRLARAVTRGHLNILCYHGFSFTDEHRFRPKLFMTPGKFATRMNWLKRSGYTTLTIGDAYERLLEGRLGSRELVITIDDGFHGVKELAAPILRDVGFTATIYVTSYYVLHQNPVFRLAVQYLFWRTLKAEVNVADIAPWVPDALPTRGVGSEAALQKLISLAEIELSEAERVSLVEALADRLNVDSAELRRTRRLSLMNLDEIRELAQQGFDIQLHTHRHRAPVDPALLVKEIDDNRSVLQAVVGQPLTHLCYPSGVWSTEMWPALRSAGIQTATTCEPNLNRSGDPPLALKRFLDFEEVPQITFEAEVAGLAHLARRALGRGRGAVRSDG